MPMSVQRLIKFDFLLSIRSKSPLPELGSHMLTCLAQSSAFHDPPTLAQCMFFLICAMAAPGFKCFGQVFVQFMMVWHRYTLKASLSFSNRSAVLMSRLSLIQR